jgi:hypothetical protein
MKAWIITGLLVIVFQSVPKQADKPSANQQTGNQSSQNTTAPQPSIRPSTNPEQNSSDGKAQKPTWCEQVAAPVVANWPLLAVAIWGILVARRTLNAIETQGNLMDKQLKEMEKAREIETKTLILQYRPKIVVRDAKALEFNFKLGEPGEGKIQFTVVNKGGSTAYITGGTIWLCSSIGHNVGNIETKVGQDGLIDTFALQPGEDIRISSSLPTGTENDLKWANFHAGLKAEPLLFLTILGVVHYKDDLGIPRRTGINRSYDPKTKTFTPSNSEGEYTD